ncbi:hypothetical protein H8R18_01965 [Nanchangia anserum]|uniref:Zinc-finger domain-containing protein n=1 Tax=Nanchangia anserum TaxID=2692125 RepID=A0A8I0GDM9_9ACTO|nr:hypothetical protein [Nanchangia anserum]MBD3690056.1 hypothetical protein [Nanchangia anserum]QOX82151.1 hypothetical protein H8R18_01965 [Nanchangia anserum]
MTETDRGGDDGCRCGCGCSGRCADSGWEPCGCGFTTEQMFAYVDACATPDVCGSGDELDEAQARLIASSQIARIRAHVAGCASCQARIARERHVRQAVALGCACRAPEGLIVRVRERLEVLSIRSQPPRG